MKAHEAMRFARKRAKLTQDQVAAEFGISRVAVSLWETGPPTGTMPEPDKLRSLARLYGCTIDEVLGGPSMAPTAGNVEEAPARYRLPIANWVSAGLREEVIEAGGSEDEQESFEGPFSEESFALRVRGDSMTRPDGAEPTFPDGCLIGVDPKQPVLSGQFGIFRFKSSDDAVFKQFFTDGPLHMLLALNPRFGPIALEPGAWWCVGRVMEKRIIRRY